SGGPSFAAFGKAWVFSSLESLFAGLFGMSAWCAMRSQDLVERARFAPAALAQGFLGEAAQFLRRACQCFLPGSLIFQRLDNLGGDGVLFLAGQGSHLRELVVYQEFQAD